jgi:hypothetical protein
VLAGARLGDDPGLAHAPGQQDLPDGVVDLVGAGVAEVLALEVDARTAQRLGQPRGERQRRRAADEVAQQGAVLGVEGRVGPSLGIGRLQGQDDGDQDLGDERPAVGAEVALRVGGGVRGHR